MWYRRLLSRGRSSLAVLGAAAVVSMSLMLINPGVASADSYVPVSGAGSTWSANALDAWIADVKQYGMEINFAAVGSTEGRDDYLENTVDFAASDIPFQTHPDDGTAPEDPTPGTFAYIPVTAGGTTFMYNLKIDGKRVTDLRLSGSNIAKIFTGQIVTWNDPAIKADNPQLDLPDTPITPVVRSDGAGSTAQFVDWMIAQNPSIWNTYCQRSGRAPNCGDTSFYPTVPGMIAQNGDLGVAGYVSQGFANGAIGYVEYSYALNARFPVAEMLNDAGYYTEPTPYNVAVSLLKAQINTDSSDPEVYLTQNLSQVYVDTDPRTYPLSSYSYLIIPTTVQGDFSDAKGKTLAAFTYYAMCQGQQEMGSLGYSPMPIDLVKDAFQQITKIPGAVVQNINVQSCNNPTFSPSGTNLLAQEAPMPPACAKQGTTQCAAGTAGDTTPTQLIGGTSVSTNSGSSSGSKGNSASVGAASSGSGGTGTGTSGSGSVAGGGSDSGSAAAADCADSGSCASGSSGSGSGSAVVADAEPSAVTVGYQGAGADILAAVCALLLIAVVLAPGLVSRFLSSRRSR